MTEQEIEAAYGPVQSQYGVSRTSVLVGFAIAAALFVIGIALAWFAFVWLRIPGARSTEQLGLMVVGGLVAFFVAPLVAVTGVRGLRDRIELRALGLVRRSRALGLKHCRYDAVARMELRGREGHAIVDLFTNQNLLIGLTGFERRADDLANDIEHRAANAGANVGRRTIGR